jgi:hypothetical protein
MSKYVDHKHGLCLGSNNIFFITHDEDAPEGVDSFRDGYRAIVWARGYHFDSINTVNVFIRTPAQQLLWERHEKRKEVEFEGHKFPEIEWYCLLKNWPIRWLEQEVGPRYKMWDVRTHAEKLFEDCIFFKRRSDAVAFVRAIDEILQGIELKTSRDKKKKKKEDD